MKIEVNLIVRGGYLAHKEMKKIPKYVVTFFTLFPLFHSKYSEMSTCCYTTNDKATILLCFNLVNKIDLTK